MNITDFILIGIIFICFLKGYAGGALKQALVILGVVFSLLMGYLFYKRGGSMIFLPLVLIVNLLVSRLIFYLIKKIAGGLKIEVPANRFFSQAAGGILGSLQGFVLVVAVLVCVHLISPMLVNANPTAASYIENSLFYNYLVEFARGSDLRPVKDIYYFGELLKKAQARGQLSGRIADKLKSSPSIKAIADDKELMQGIKNRDYKKVLSSPKFIKLLKDQEFIKQFGQMDFKSVYEEQAK